MFIGSQENLKRKKSKSWNALQYSFLFITLIIYCHSNNLCKLFLVLVLDLHFFYTNIFSWLVKIINKILRAILHFHKIEVRFCLHATPINHPAFVNWAWSQMDHRRPLTTSILCLILISKWEKRCMNIHIWNKIILCLFWNCYLWFY